MGLTLPSLATRPTVARAATQTSQDPAPTADADRHARLEAIYTAANAALQAGNYAAAAERYAEVLRVLAESRETHEPRALALLDSVAARRQAQAQGVPHQLCRARDLTRDYLLSARATHGPAAAQLDGVRQAEQLQRELVGEISRLSDPTCPGDQVEVIPMEPAPLRLAPAPERGPSPRMVGGSILVGIGGLGAALLVTGLGLGERARKQLQQARRDDPGRDIDGWLASDPARRGHVANGLAIAGGVLAGAALVAGITLLAVGKARDRRAARIDVSRGALRLRF